MAKTLDEILKNRNIVTQEQADRIEMNAMKEAEKYWGGKRAGAGKKPELAKFPRNKQIKVAEVTKEAILYAYSIGIAINLDDVKLIQYAKEHNLTLAKLQKI